MRSKINQILANFNKKKNEFKAELYLEYEKLKDKYGFKIIGRKIIFSNESKLLNKKEKKSIFESIFNAKIREVLSIPFIFSIIIPALILDLFISIYHSIAFRLYKIPLVKRDDYIIFDRGELDYLNIIQKVNCHYCSYVNGLFAYCVEIAGRTERYWCPIKASKKMKAGHEWQQYFADYGDAKGFKATTCQIQKENDYKNIDNLV